MGIANHDETTATQCPISNEVVEYVHVQLTTDN